ncbi:MAG: hypothetical protein KJ579_02480 [Verrucomicrobia bacterium]|nr:hypothetical protein [Verrucomicrobiota bacterium]
MSGEHTQQLSDLAPTTGLPVGAFADPPAVVVVDGMVTLTVTMPEGMFEDLREYALAQRCASPEELILRILHAATTPREFAIAEFERENYARHGEPHL